MMDWSESSSSGSSDEEEGGEDMLDLEGLKLPVSGYIAAGDETKRLAIVDLDWSRVKAVDLFGVLQVEILKRTNLLYETTISLQQTTLPTYSIN